MTDFSLRTYQAPADLLRERVILITGAESGLGRATALACAAHGATVVLLGRNETMLEQAYDAIEAAGYPRPALVPVNLETAAFHEYTQLAEHLERELGRLDGLVHNAATLGVLSPVAHYNPEIWARTLQVDLHAPFLLTRACLPLLTRGPDSSVIFVSDTVGRRGRAFWGAYAVAKAGLERLMEVMADELENEPVRVNSLDPGRLRTLLRARAYPGEDPNTVPLPETAVAPLLYLLGPESQEVRGQTLTL
ncbi:Uncharacterized oxidoreductase YciK [Gammaproteobacteria bacterium]